ncbi:MAG: hypothetical protein J6Q83_01910 [Clostridia bacterium]|nr:hypothetical protein [Clostridia bacterium]
MDEKKGFGYKLQKNPFLVVLLIVVIGVAIFMISTLSSALKDKIKQAEETTAVETTAATTVAVTEPDDTIAIDGLKKYSDKIVSVTAHKEKDRVALRVEYDKKESLLADHLADNAFSIDVVPMFCFYIDNGLQVKCPGELRLLDSGNVVMYYLSEVDDYVNAVGLTDELTVTLDNILNTGFNLYIEHKTNDGVGKTICGSYAQTVEDFNSKHAGKPAEVVDVAKGIKKVETTLSDEFIWVDIYYTDVDSYTSLNNDFITNFVVFGLEKGGKNFKRDFIVTEYDNLNMVRCKFDSYALKELAKEMDEPELTVKELFENYSISVWSTDYEKETALFSLNGSSDVMNNINTETTAAEGEETTISEAEVTEA